MTPTRLVLSVSLLTVFVAVSASAGPTSHALEVTTEGSIFFVDLDQNRLLRLFEGELSVASGLEGIPAGEHLQNLVLTIDGDLYIGTKKTVWKISPEGRVESTKPPKNLKSLFAGKPGDLGRDGSVYLARDSRNIERSLPGGDDLPVLATDHIGRINSMSVTPYGRIFFGNSSEVAKLEADGSVKIFLELEGDDVLGLAALGENRFLLLRRVRGGAVSLQHVDAFGNVRVLLTPDQIASASSSGPVAIPNPE